MKKFNIIKNEYGSTVLLMTILILASVLVVSLSASDVVKNGLVMGRDRVYSTKAFFAAEAGAEKVLYEIRKNNFFDSVCNSGEDFCFDSNDVLDSCSPGCVDACEKLGCADPLTKIHNIPYNSTSYTINYTVDGTKNKIRCTGYYKNISRIVELTY